MTRTRILTLLSAALLGGLASPASAGPALRGDVSVGRDALTVGDLLSGVPASHAETPLFRAPALGQSGTIQVKRIAAALEALGLGSVDTGGRLQVTVTRAARHVGPSEIEAAVKARLAKEFGADPASTGIAFDGEAPRLVLPPDATGEAIASDVVLDRRSKRVVATVWVGPSPTERRDQVRITGSVLDLVEVAVATKPLERGQALASGDMAIERRSRDSVPSDVILDGLPLEGRVARRAMSTGSLLRPADLVRPELVGRGDIVTVVYEMPGVSLSMRAKSNDPGTLGDTVSIVNPQSKKTLQAVVIGPGRVSVSTAPPGRLAAAVPAR